MRKETVDKMHRGINTNMSKIKLTVDLSQNDYDKLFRKWLEFKGMLPPQDAIGNPAPPSWVLHEFNNSPVINIKKELKRK